MNKRNQRVSSTLKIGKSYHNSSINIHIILAKSLSDLKKAINLTQRRQSPMRFPQIELITTRSNIFKAEKPSVITLKSTNGTDRVTGQKVQTFDLISENDELKKEIKKLKEENHSLKFIFERLKNQVKFGFIYSIVIKMEQ